MQMVALTLNRVDDMHSYVESFSGSDRLITDYLMDEVLAQRPSDTREFLQQTSILPRLNADLCNAVTGGSDGLGKHLTRTLVELGATVFFCARNRERGEKVAADIRAEGHQAIAVQHRQGVWTVDPFGGGLVNLPDVVEVEEQGRPAAGEVWIP